MRIPFDIKYRAQIESGEYKIKTRDGRPARVICWDRFATKYSNNIVALITGDESETAYYYYQDGHLWSKANDEADSSLDLFIITPEPELSELEEAAEEYANKEFPNEPAIGQWGTGDYEPPVDMEYPREIAKEAFIAGINWQKEQILKDAVEAYIVKSYNPCTENSELFLHGVELLYEDKNKPYLLAGNKVRIIVLKEKEE